MAGTSGGGINYLLDPLMNNAGVGGPAPQAPAAAAPDPVNQLTQPAAPQAPQTLQAQPPMMNAGQSNPYADWLAQMYQMQPQQQQFPSWWSGNLYPWQQYGQQYGNALGSGGMWA
jgi:hypothetical protein